MQATTIAEGNYLGLYSRDGWEFSDRPNATGVVGILPITADGQLVLIEQYRVPVQARMIEIPAGLVGDEEEFQGESLADCAGRELLEETGYRAGVITHLLSSPTSAGMTSETTHFFAATDLHRESAGGGTESEDITVHHIAIAELTDWLKQQESAGKLIDFKIHACMFLAQQSGLTTSEA
ncbi:NUDIX hydrolase [Verrucomicrobiaceae bacterium 5K15]|uniref:GDP-mannose pyrophosphatase n=1 Tax=Oceaniferula flava TaxID=2800421 RepID=A0AAE2S9M3_9BACT|nr:NUDIX hydrolase [Oceaniferula flavus]MBK1853354.1 NUDIX hydrolase [Oceaniferula flavus]MBM1134659.1 NUDIX hydrolase [Oceaniferula flavus]